MSSPEPALLLADSQLLFARSATEPSALAALEARLTELGVVHPRAAYFGASNGDAPEFFELFQAAMEGINIADCRHISATPSPADLDFAASAEVLLFAGGDVSRGWTTFETNGIPDLARRRYYDGAHLIGISAGAVHLGLGSSRDGSPLAGGFAIVPFVVDAHDEPEWRALELAVARSGNLTRGLGIPTGGGVRYHADYSLEPLRHPAVEISMRENGPLERSLLLPAQAEAGPNRATTA